MPPNTNNQNPLDQGVPPVPNQPAPMNPVPPVYAQAPIASVPPAYNTQTPVPPVPPKKTSVLKIILIIFLITCVLGLIAIIGLFFVARNFVKEIKETSDTFAPIAREFVEESQKPLEKMAATQTNTADGVDQLKLFCDEQIETSFTDIFPGYTSARKSIHAGLDGIIGCSVYISSHENRLNPIEVSFSECVLEDTVESCRETLKETVFAFSGIRSSDLIQTSFAEYLGYYGVKTLTIQGKESSTLQAFTIRKANGINLRISLLAPKESYAALGSEGLLDGFRTVVSRAK